MLFVTQYKVLGRLAEGESNHQWMGKTSASLPGSLA